MTIYDEFYATAAWRAQLRNCVSTAYMARIFVLPIESCTRRGTSNAAAADPASHRMAGWKAIGWIYSWIKQLNLLYTVACCLQPVASDCRRTVQWSYGIFGVCASD